MKWVTTSWTHSSLLPKSYYDLNLDYKITLILYAVGIRHCWFTFKIKGKSPKKLLTTTTYFHLRHAKF